MVGKRRAAGERDGTKEGEKAEEMQTQDPGEAEKHQKAQRDGKEDKECGENFKG